MYEYFPDVWRNHLYKLLNHGIISKPRGIVTKELIHSTISVDMNRPVLTVPARQLSYQFMAAEAYWILTGRKDVASIAPFNKRISDFSDNGFDFFGAYGPKIIDQMDYVVNTLAKDNNTRQACLTIWRENPPASKDIPCTVAITFNIRGNLMHTSVFMRSSDIWLGIPYDVFTFSMLTNLICAHLNERDIKMPGCYVRPGVLNLTAASSHLYESDFENAKKCVNANPYIQAQTPQIYHRKSSILLWALKELRSSKKDDSMRWWNKNDKT
jgi:thymidylate synthase